ncbi:MAG TPA: thiamine pyrophosphate-dependent enzyme [Burkholderiales bacterium]|nr:thiamine pyrophosphate-dependent enzyme [Burkholderiales bacterium]
MMDTAEMLKVYNRYRGDAIVVPGRGGRHWVKISSRRGRDVELGDPAMGGHASFAMGLALAQPGEKIVLFDSEGDIQMGMGVLVTIAEQQPKNFYHFMLDNECYATTGGQPVPHAKTIAYDAIARACGYARTYAYDNLETFSINVERILGEPGPVFVALKVRADIENKPIGSRVKWRTRSQVQVVQDLKKELGIG